MSNIIIFNTIPYISNSKGDLDDLKCLVGGNIEVVDVHSEIDIWSGKPNSYDAICIMAKASRSGFVCEESNMIVLWETLFTIMHRINSGSSDMALALPACIENPREIADYLFSRKLRISKVITKYYCESTGIEGQAFSELRMLLGQILSILGGVSSFDHAYTTFQRHDFVQFEF